MAWSVLQRPFPGPLRDDPDERRRDRHRQCAQPLRYAAGPHPGTAGSLPGGLGHVLVDPVGAGDLREDDRGARAPGEARRRARRRWHGERAGRAAAEARRDRERDPVAHAGRPRRRRDRRVRGERGARDPARRICDGERRTACCSIRSTARRTSTCAAASARSSASCAKIAARASRRLRCCSRARSRSPPATCSTVRRRCSC